MDSDILQIKITEESRNWDSMVDKIEAYLIKHAQKKMKHRDQEYESRQLKEEENKIESKGANQEKESAEPAYADDHSKSLKFKYEDIKDIKDE